MFTKFRTTAIVFSILTSLLAGAALGAIFILLSNPSLVMDTSISIILATGLIGIVSATVGYLGGASANLTDDSGPPPWVALLKAAIDKIS